MLLFCALHGRTVGVPLHPTGVGLDDMGVDKAIIDHLLDEVPPLLFAIQCRRMGEPQTDVLPRGRFEALGVALPRRSPRAI